MKNKIKYIICSLSLLALLIVSCEDNALLVPELPTAVSFNLASDDVLVQPGGSSYNLEVQSTTVSNMDRTYTATLNQSQSTGLPAEYAFNGSMTIPAGSLIGFGTISFDYDAIPLGVTRRLVFDLEPVGAGEVYNETRTTVTINYSAFCPYNTVSLKITFDNWPEEIYWSLEDGSGAVVAESATPAAYGAYAGMTGSVSRIFCLVDGTYTFTIYDAYGDGAGPYSITSDGVVLVQSNGAYGGGESRSFTL